jgi:hypothetical protein
MTIRINLTTNPLTLPPAPTRGIVAAIGPRNAIPKECWDAYYDCRVPQGLHGTQVATTPKQIGWMVTEMFYSGLSSLKLNLKPHVTNTEQEVLAFFRCFLGSWEPQHEHKFAWCIYLLSQCCTSVEWSPK